MSANENIKHEDESWSIVQHDLKDDFKSIIWNSWVKPLIFIDYSNLDLSPFKLKNKFKNDFNFFDHNDLSKLITSKNKKIDKYSFYLKKKYKNNWQKLFKSF